MSLATKRSGQPSWSTSSIATPSDLELESNTPLFAVTSLKVPLPLLRNSHAGRAPVGLRRAVRLVLPVEAAEHVLLGRPSDVVADEQVEQPVPIDIDPDGGRAEPLPRVEPAALRDVDERALAGIAEQAVLTDARHQQVGKPVVVPVTHRHAHPVHLVSRPAARVTSVKVPSRLLR